ncbi:hypothetical protein BRADI_1g30867v3 [Brachypodium distachyon]|uniref:Uncharacterized protein n=1 Tax=Brachypodium distachyon TaxID=15368 RepID=A0A2K2DM65_BRADI|nr:hypothetical protein BRADI_1g30867v3 [Brachypodium distachyon]
MSDRQVRSSFPSLLFPVPHSLPVDHFSADAVHLLRAPSAARRPHSRLPPKRPPSPLTASLHRRVWCCGLPSCARSRPRLLDFSAQPSARVRPPGNICFDYHRRQPLVLRLAERTTVDLLGGCATRAPSSASRQLRWLVGDASVFYACREDGGLAVKREEDGSDVGSQ